MELLPLLLILGLFLLPSLFMMRSQRRRAREVEAMRASLVPGDRIVSVAGVHGTVVAVGEQGQEQGAIDVEIAPGVVVTMELAGVMKKDAEVMP